MKLVPRELDKLVIFTAARMAERRKNEGIKLNYPEAIAIIADYVVESARKGHRVAQIMKDARTVLTTDDVMPGVADMIRLVQVELHSRTEQSWSAYTLLSSPRGPKNVARRNHAWTGGH